MFTQLWRVRTVSACTHVYPLWFHILAIRTFCSTLADVISCEHYLAIDWWMSILPPVNYWPLCQRRLPLSTNCYGYGRIRPHCSSSQNAFIVLPGGINAHAHLTLLWLLGFTQVWPFLPGSRLCKTDRHANIVRSAMLFSVLEPPPQSCPFVDGDLAPRCGFFDPREFIYKTASRLIDPFCRAYQCVQRTGTHTQTNRAL